jgi:23S rRNA (cytosine1962-C5)-methyltransferase
MGNQTNSERLIDSPDLTPANAVTLKPGREKPVLYGHPWIFSGSLERVPATLGDGEIAEVYAANGRWLARGYLNRASQITIRLLTWQQSELITDAFWQRRLEQAVALRRRLFPAQQTTTYRLVNAESDFLPGLTVDRYDRTLVMQVGTLGIERRKEQLAQMLLALTDCDGVIERSAMSVRQHEGLGEASGLLAGAPPPTVVTVREHGLRFQVDLLRGQKTGFFTDQRENRRRVAAYAQGQRVLNAFCYTGAFAVYTLAAGATHVTNLDSSRSALELAEENLRLNGFDPNAQTENLLGDVFTILRDWRREGNEERYYDLIILDPPKFAQSKEHVPQALRGYKEINLSAMHLLRPGGLLATFSCSGLVRPHEFQQAVLAAAVDAGRTIQQLEWLHQASDHPVAATFPEGEYLKGLICRML